MFTPHSQAAVTSIAGGFVMFVGSHSPLTHAVGLGMHGPVTPDDMDRVEDFYLSRDCPVTIDLCPYADPSLRELLAERRYWLSDYATVMVRELKADSVPPGLETPLTVRAAEPLDMETWSDTVIRGFFGRNELTPEETHLGRVIFSLPAAQAYLIECDDEPVGGGTMSVRNGVASFFGDAVLPAFRRRGGQSALLRVRLTDAIAAGCDIATANTQPGSASQLNYQRVGFSIAYTKVMMVHE